MREIARYRTASESSTAEFCLTGEHIIDRNVLRRTRNWQGINYVALSSLLSGCTCLASVSS